MAARTTSKANIVIKPIKEDHAIIRVVGTTPLIVHKWSHKAMASLPGWPNDPDITENKKQYSGPWESFIESAYWIEGKPVEYTQEAFEEAVKNGARWGVKVEGFKRAAIDASYTKGWSKKTEMRGFFFIEPDYTDEEGNQLVEIKGSVPVMRQDIVRLSGIGNSADLRWRPQFNDWYCDIKVAYDSDSKFSLKDIANMIHAGGRYCGIGEWRPQKNGQFGMYRVAPAK